MAAASIALPWQGVAIAAGRDAKIEKLVTAYRQRHGNAAFSFALRRKGTVVYANAFGEADEGVPLTTDHRSRIGSISKTITASAIMRLIEDGKVSLDDRIFGEGGILNARFPIQNTPLFIDNVKAITVDHLLTHTCGGWPNWAGDPLFDASILDLDGLIRYTLLIGRVSHPPGTQYEYSNFGFSLLGRVIEVVTGGSYADFVHREILDPAGAGGMYLGKSRRNELGADEVKYLDTGDRAPYLVQLDRIDSAGGWVGSPTDLVNFALAVDGESAPADVIGKASVETMRRPSKAYGGYGHGWNINAEHQNRNRWHNGSLPGATTWLVLMPGSVAFASFSNTRDSTSHVEMNDLNWDIHKVLMG